MSTHAQQIAEQIVGQTDWRGETFGWCVCPGKEFHTGPSGHRDCRVRVIKENGFAPGVYCLHSSCSGVCAERSHELRVALWKDELEDEGESGKKREFKPSPPPYEEPTFSPTALEKFTSKITETVDDEWLAARSPIRPDNRTPASFLHALYRPGERVIIFDVYESQGQYLWEHRGFPFDARELDRFRKGARCGVWFLTQPVDGEYHINENGDQSRRSKECVTAWRYTVVESDHDSVTREQWLKLLVRLRMDIVAIYDTGGRLPHALVQLPPCRTKEEWNAHRDHIKPLLIQYGADPGTLTAVRLSRLPQCERRGKIDKHGNYCRFPEPHLQRLLYLCPPNRYLPEYLPSGNDRYLPILERPIL